MSIDRPARPSRWPNIHDGRARLHATGFVRANRGDVRADSVGKPGLKEPGFAPGLSSPLADVGHRLRHAVGTRGLSISQPENGRGHDAGAGLPIASVSGLFRASRAPPESKRSPIRKPSNTLIG